VEGNCTLIDLVGKEAASEGNFALCRCGGSKNKPFCDGTHIKSRIVATFFLVKDAILSSLSHFFKKRR